MQILYGDNTTASRAQLVKLMDAARANHKEIVRVEAKRLDPASLQDVLGSATLFGTPRLIVIDELHSLPKSKKKDVLLDAVAQISTQLDDQTELIIWEKRALTATMLKRFGNVSATEFKLSSALFKWLESISPQKNTKPTQLTLFHQALAQDDTFMCFAMLTRQVRLLLQARDGGVIKGAPFMIAKLKKQAQLFSLEQLLKLHARLLEIDLEEKSSSRTLSLEQKLDLLMIEL